MSTWNQRLLPYPLLAPWTGDYPDGNFGVDVPEAALNNGREISIDLVFQLSSESLRALIDSGRASYAVDVSCPKTFVRYTSRVTWNDRLVLEAGDYSEEILLTPYLIATCPLEGFISPEHASEWIDHRPDGFGVPNAGILAVGNTTRIVLEDAGVHSVIDLVANPAVLEGTLDIRLDEDRIKIHVSLTDKEKIEAVRKRRGAGVEFAALFPGIYLHAVAEALRNLLECEDTRWAFAVRNALENHGLGNIGPELLRDDALRYAQELMKHPVGIFLAAALTFNDEGLTH